MKLTDSSRQEIVINPARYPSTETLTVGEVESFMVAIGMPESEIPNKIDGWCKAVQEFVYRGIHDPKDALALISGLVNSGNEIGTDYPRAISLAKKLRGGW
jgi:hypothetical protein